MPLISWLHSRAKRTGALEAEVGQGASRATDSRHTMVKAGSSGTERTMLSQLQVPITVMSIQLEERRVDGGRERERLGDRIGRDTPDPGR